MESGLSIQKTVKNIQKNKKAPSVHFPENSKYYEEAKIYIEENFSENYGNLTSYQLYPVTFEEAENWLNQFLELRFADFGVYEDSIVEREHFLHHSVLSPFLNIGLLTAENVLKEAIDYAEEYKNSYQFSGRICTSNFGLERICEGNLSLSGKLSAEQKLLETSQSASRIFL